ncbi:hypothetical protein DYBT9623_00897 [Dyadobacter sp. CECT 9623]|uniref:Uncharacterized protein n=1 Tax=Dyadobacter linearis TaxID=2823330 RepID=A0ABM8ULA4_9BACT|nr:hypothetical protein [Dyadobacter sp. CECT 9623]CAG5068168.1 hypothetical protein DYBT9623_00897 [Dyadobacter sp. CECT 9623]
MKTAILSIAMFFLTATGAAFAQSTTQSTNPKQKATGDTASNSAGSIQGERRTTDGRGKENQGGPATATQAGRATGAGKRSEPGGKSNGDATGKTKLPGNQNEATNQSGSAGGNKSKTPKSTPKQN